MSRMHRSSAICALAFCALATAPALAQSVLPGTDDTAARPEAAIISGGPLDRFRAVRNTGDLLVTGDSFVQLADMQLSIATRSGSTMLITFSGECRAGLHGGPETTVVVQVQVDGVPIPGYNDLLFCSNKQFYVETHSMQWTADAPRRRQIVSVHARVFPGTETALFSDRALTVMFREP